MFRRKFLSIIFWVVLIVIFITPFPTTITPEQKVRAVDETGKPIPYAVFRQMWNHYSYGISETEFLTADEDGYVVLPKRTFTAPLLYRIIRSGFAYLMLLAHGSIGAGGTVNAVSDECSSDLLEYNSSKPLSDLIVIGC